MTVVTCGGNHQSGFKQTPAMDTLCIVLNNIVLGDIIYPGHNFPFFVASSAEVGDIHLIGARFGIAVMEYIVVTMTFFAAGCIRVIPQQRLSMGPSDIVCQLLGVADSAIDWFQIISMGKTFICRICVAG